jgi:DNA-binding IclR family transcriptional regulator
MEEIREPCVDNIEEKAKSGYSDLVPAVDQASKILLCLSRTPSSKMNLTEICKIVGIHKSKGYSILNTLQKFGFVQKDLAGKTYSLGLGLIALSRRVLDNLNYSEVAGPLLDSLSRKTHCTALFGLNSEYNVFIVAKQESDQNIGITTRVGHRFSITHGAHGKAIVAFSSPEERERILGQERLYFHGDASKFDRARLEKEIAECRRTGYAVDMGDLNPGMNIIASPVFGAQGEVIGSLFIMGTFPEALINEYGLLVTERAKRFSTMLGADIEKTYRT